MEKLYLPSNAPTNNLQIHIVNFDASGKIQQVRQNWDQGSLLKLIDIIGRTGKNWPIHDGKDQLKLITSSVKLTGQTTSDTKSEKAEPVRSRGNSHPTGDPHATLSLFAPREKYEGDSLPAAIGTRTSAKPVQKNFHDLFVENEEPIAETPGHKNGAKQYAPSRLFEQDDAQPIGQNHFSPKVNAKKFQHFDLANVPVAGEDDDEDARLAAQHQHKSKHTSQWNFDDFNTPAKVVPTKLLRTNDVRHWGNSDDEVVDSPIKFNKVHKPRKDAEPHFEFKDDGTPDQERRRSDRPRGTQANNGMGLYKDRLFGDEENTPQPKNAALQHDGVARHKVFDSQFDMHDVSPAQNKTAPRISEDRAKAVKNMDASWGSYDKSPVANQKESNPTSPTLNRSAKGPLSESTNLNQSQGINISGDGMGGRKNLANRDSRPLGIATGGDGMGGRKGAGRTWGFGDESDGEEAGGINVPGKFQTGKTQGKKIQPTGGDFWDF